MSCACVWHCLRPYNRAHMTDRLKNVSGNKSRRPATEPVPDLTSLLTAKLVGQPNVIESVVPYVEMFQAGLAPENRPVGVFLLLGPTGTGKTRTVEVLAEALHGSVKNILKVDCGEFQLEHEVARLIGAPPGYLGHRETQPMLSQQKLSAVTSGQCGLSLILFDEIEKAATALSRLLLGVLDRGVLRLGDNTSVNFENSLIFLTSNLGAKEMMREIHPDFGFQPAGAEMRGNLTGKLQAIGMTAVKRKFSPEFVNRIDRVITYRPLDRESLSEIADHEVAGLQKHISSRLGSRAFQLDVPRETRQWLIDKGTSVAYGARELKRTIHRNITQPLASLVARNQVEPASRLSVSVTEDGEGLRLETAPDEGNIPTVLLVDDNRAVLKFLEDAFVASGWSILSAGTVGAARKLIAKCKPDAALIDHLLPDGTGLELAQLLRQTLPDLAVTLMTGSAITEDENDVCAASGFQFLSKPFEAAEAVKVLRSGLSGAVENCSEI